MTIVCDKKQHFLLKQILKSGDCSEIEITGKNPLLLGGKKLIEAGLTPRRPLQAIREKCIDCCCGSLVEVRKCIDFECANWPHRFGKDGFRSKGKVDE